MEYSKVLPTTVVAATFVDYLAKESQQRKKKEAEGF